ECKGKKLAAGGACMVTVRYAPAAPGDATGKLTVSALQGGSAAATLSGSAQTAAALTVSPPSNGFGLLDPGSSSSAVPFMVQNTGAEPSSVPLVSIGGADAADFMIMANGCVAPLAKDETCEVDVVFAPATGGDKSASLDVSGSPGGDASAMLQGAATVLLTV